MYNVLIVEDDPMARKLLEIFIATSDQYHLVPSLDSAAMAELYCMTTQVDLILMDVCTAMDANGIEAAEKLKKLYPRIKIIITSQPEYSYIAHARKIGVESFWYKEPTDAAIAETLCLSVARVKQHIQRIREKTQFANRTELAVRARESGLVIGDYKPM